MHEAARTFTRWAVLQPPRLLFRFGVVFAANHMSRSFCTYKGINKATNIQAQGNNRADSPAGLVAQSQTHRTKKADISVEQSLTRKGHPP